MARISTGTGDDGTTGLVGGARVRKTSVRVRAYGAVDELNDALGVVTAFTERADLIESLRTIQEDLFTLGADLSAPDGVETLRVTEAHVARLVAHEDRLEAVLPQLKNFILPGGTKTAAFLQVARTSARHAEREAWRLEEEERGVNPHALTYLNRLSDLLFLLAREENMIAGEAEPAWKGRHK